MVAQLESRHGNLEPSAHKPQVGSSSLPTATNPLPDNDLTPKSHVSNHVVRNRYFLGQSLAILLCPAANGKVFGVTIDKEDLPRVLEVGVWRVANFDAANHRVNLYCYCKSKGRHIYLHRFILNAPKDRRIEVDHSHHRNFDNRKSEIRLVTKSVNQRNKRPKRLAEPTGATEDSASGRKERIWRAL